MISFPRMILLSLAIFGDVVRVLPKSKRESWNFWFGNYHSGEKIFNHSSFYNSVSRLLKAERIERVIVGNKIKIRITPQGLKFLAKTIDLPKFQRRAWDKKWRVVVFDVYEKDKKQRDRIRAVIKGWGFGMLQESVWISPFPIEAEISEYFTNWKIRGEILVCRAEVLVGDQAEVAERTWKLGQLRRRYRKLTDFWSGFGRRKGNKKSAFHYQRRYLELVALDPFLPKELLPADWPYWQAAEVYKDEVLPLLSK